MKRAVIAVLAALTFSLASAQDFEVGVQYDTSGFAPFVYVTEDVYLTTLSGVNIDLWFSPSVEVTFGRSWWAQGQFIADHDVASFSLRGKYDSSDNSFEARVGVLFEL